ncbi:MAG: hypothetical protein AVDCRST_MAG68-4171, partial [uncultured Gemmatimonadetes bacterium]
ATDNGRPGTRVGGGGRRRGGGPHAQGSGARLPPRGRARQRAGAHHHRLQQPGGRRARHPLHEREGPAPPPGLGQDLRGRSL